jgi:hypothetical protein
MKSPGPATKPDPQCFDEAALASVSRPICDVRDGGTFAFPPRSRSLKLGFEKCRL